MTVLPPQNVTVVFTPEEASVLLQLIDVAVKSVGLNAAKAAFILAEKIQQSAQPPGEVVAPT